MQSIPSAIIALLALCGLVAAGCADPPKANAVAVKLEAAGSNGEFPWTDSLVPLDLPVTPSTADGSRSLPTPAAAGDEAETVMSTVSGDRTGLYGGSGDIAVCDKEKLVAFLQANPDKGKAWSSVLGVTDIAAYVRSLTPVVLRVDTLVTNHGFENGVAVPVTSVLQAGTAVLVDANGVPRVRCACGNPLTPPRPPSGDVQFSGKKWTGFTPTSIFMVAPSTEPLTKFDVVDLKSGLFVTIPAGDTAPAAVATPDTPAAAAPPPVNEAEPEAQPAAADNSAPAAEQQQEQPQQEQPQQEQPQQEQPQQEQPQQEQPQQEPAEEEPCCEDTWDDVPVYPGDDSGYDDGGYDDGGYDDGGYDDGGYDDGGYDDGGYDDGGGYDGGVPDGSYDDGGTHDGGSDDIKLN